MVGQQFPDAASLVRWQPAEDALTLPLFAGVLSPGTTRPFCAVPRTSVAHIASG
jgi:hypothetical protein